MAACLPPHALLLAGVRLDELRASPLYPRLPAAARTYLEPLRDASTLLVAFDGTGILSVAQGRFREPPPGATAAGADLMLSGSAALVEAAQAQRRSGPSVANDLLAQASAAAEGHTVWIAARGGVNLPLTGDAANLNRFLRLADSAAAGLRLDPAQVDFTAQCATPASAQHLEETLRAFLSLSAAGLARQPALSAMLRGADVRRESTAVRASLTAPADAVAQLFEFLAK